MRNLLCVGTQIFVLVTCANCAHVRVSDYELGAREPTPMSWSAGTAWTIVLARSDGSILDTLTIRTTEDPEDDSCGAGDRKKVEILSDGVSESVALREPASYSVIGAAIEINFNTHLCDAEYKLMGRISEEGLVGTHNWRPWSGVDATDRFYGIPAVNPESR